MSKYCSLLLAFAAFLATDVRADEWLRLAGNDDKNMYWEGRRGTLSPNTNKAGKQLWVAQGRVINNGSISFEQWYVTAADCKLGYGKVVTLTMSGDFKFDNEFVLNGGSVAATLAEMLCSQELANQGKGI